METNIHSAHSDHTRHCSKYFIHTSQDRDLDHTGLHIASITSLVYYVASLKLIFHIFREGLIILNLVGYYEIKLR